MHNCISSLSCHMHIYIQPLSACTLQWPAGVRWISDSRLIRNVAFWHPNHVANQTAATESVFSIVHCRRPNWNSDLHVDRLILKLNRVVYHLHVCSSCHKNNNCTVCTYTICGGWQSWHGCTSNWITWFMQCVASSFALNLIEFAFYVRIISISSLICFCF